MSGDGGAPSPRPGGPVSLPRRTTLRIAGMRTVHCVRAVFTALAGVDGIARADVTMGRAVVEHDGRGTPERLREAVALAGYEVEESTEERPRTLPLL